MLWSVFNPRVLGQAMSLASYRFTNIRQLVKQAYNQALEFLLGKNLIYFGPFTSCNPVYC